MTSIDPPGPGALLLRARESLIAGDPAASLAICEQILASDPGLSEAWHLSGLAEASQDNLSGAIRKLRRATACPDARSLHFRDLGVAFTSRKMWRAAARAFQRALALEPDDTAALSYQARTLFELGRPSQALEICRSALRLQPAGTRDLLILARALELLGSADDAADCVGRVLQIDPGCAAAHRLRLHLCRSRRSYDDALHAATGAVHAVPDDADLRLQYGIALFDAGRTSEALTPVRESRDALPERYDVGSAYLNVLLHGGAHTGDLLLSESLSWSARHCPKRSRPPYPNSCEPERKLNVGYLTGEFARVPSYYFLHPILAGHDRTQVKVFCYHSRPSCDEFTKSIEAVSDEWRDVSGMTDEQVARRIRRDRIDVLVDFSGHYVFNRLLVFAQRPAPVQVTLPNYPATTGLPVFDAILTDRWTTPPGSEHEYSEPVWRLDPGYLPYIAPTEAPEISPSSRTQTGALQFGVFQRPGKLTAEFWDCAAAILQRVPGSALLVQYGSADLDDKKSDSSRRVRHELARRGIAEHRVILRGILPRDQRLQLISQVDIALDSFPYNGQTTTCECLWMGVPVVTLYGTSHVGRVGGGILRRIGLDSLVAENTNEYVDMAVRLAQDGAGLDLCRETLRRRMAKSTLMKDNAVARAVESAYRELWREWCFRKRRRLHGSLSAPVSGCATLGGGG